MNKISSEPFLSGYTYRSLASQAICDNGDTRYMKSTCNGINPNEVIENELLYVTGNQTKRFFIEIAPKIKNKFSVITAQTDPGVDASYVKLLPDNLVTWWSINVHVDHSKIKPIPLGLQNLHWRYNGNIQSDPETYKKYQPNPKEKKILGSFSVQNNHHERSTCLNAAKKINCDFRMFKSEDRKNESYVDDYFNTVSRYKFVLCPWGAGIDTHRLWETLYLGSIPITRRHRVYRDFEDFPILFLDDWLELIEIDFESTYNYYKEKLQTENRIYFEYWNNKIIST
jgi:hypothetical protein